MMKNKTKGHEKKKHSRVTRLTFTLIAFGLTLISAYNGFKFYKILFGFFMAVLVSSTFELARVACLFKYRNSEKKAGTLAFILYSITALVCAFASINSFTAEVIKRNRVNEKEVQAQIYQIKKTYSVKAIETIASLNKNIKYLENQVAKYPDSNYWKRRLSQYTLDRDKEIKKRDLFLESNPENPTQWITSKAPLLGIKIKTLSPESEDITSIKLALKEVWGLSGVATQKIIGIVVTVTVELCILLFSILATERRKQLNVNEKILKNKDVLEALQCNFDETKVKKFLAACKKHFKKTGKILPMRKLNPNLRPIMDYLKTFDRLSLEELMKK